MALDGLPFLRGQGLRFRENLFWNLEFSDIVEQGGEQKLLVVRLRVLGQLEYLERVIEHVPFGVILPRLSHVLQGQQQQAKERADQQLRELLQNLGVVSDSLQQSLQTLSQVSHTLQKNYAKLLNTPGEETS